jgi:ABC-type Na+ transport system ATPase subunit NatA
VPERVWGVRDLTLRANEGVFGLLGPNGAGTATLVQVPGTLARPTAGAILVERLRNARS